MTDRRRLMRGARASETGVPATAAHGPRPYDRDRDLPRLIALWPEELRDTTTAGRHRLLAKLRRALRAERQRGLAGHWTYDLARHAQLLAAYQCECRAVSPPGPGVLQSETREQRADATAAERRR